MKAIDILRAVKAKLDTENKLHSDNSFCKATDNHGFCSATSPKANKWTLDGALECFGEPSQQVVAQDYLETAKCRLEDAKRWRDLGYTKQMIIVDYAVAMLAVEDGDQRQLWVKVLDLVYPNGIPTPEARKVADIVAAIDVLLVLAGDK